MKKYKAIFHLDEENRANLTFRNVKGLLRDLEDDVVVKLLANSEGIKALLQNGPYIEEMIKLAEMGVSFAICSNTLRSMSLKKEDFPDFVTVVSSGTGELVRKQTEGWAYIRP